MDRRAFLARVGATTATGVLASNWAKGAEAPAAMPPGGTAAKPATRTGTLKCFNCDLNWIQGGVPATTQDWAFVDPQRYFDWHRDFGNNVMFCQAYAFGGHAFYPTKLGAVAPGPGAQLLPRLYELAQKTGMPFMSHFCVGADLTMSNQRNEWVVPKSRDAAPSGFLAPESPWTQLLCQRVREFLQQFPVEWLLFDWFVYGSLTPNDSLVQPGPYVAKPFQDIIGRLMPKTAAEITPEEHLKYKREVLARQFRAIRDAVRETSPGTRIGFNVPYWKADEAIWSNHPMVNESDFIFAECTSEDVMEWALKVRKPSQRVFTTITGRPDGTSKPDSWRKWYTRGCDFFGYAWGTPPDFRPNASHGKELKIVRAAFKEMS